MATPPKFPRSTARPTGHTSGQTPGHTLAPAAADATAPVTRRRPAASPRARVLRSARPARGRRLVALVGVLAASCLTVGTAIPFASAAVDQGAMSRQQPSRLLQLTRGLRPEGITAFGNNLYVSSLADGRIVKVNQTTGRQTTFLQGRDGRQLLGMQVDGRSGLLYVVGNLNGSGIMGAIDINSGQVVTAWQVPDAGFLNDVVITRNAVFATDSMVDRLIRIPLDDNANPSQRFATVDLSGDWPGSGGFGANGIRALQDGTLIMDHTSFGGLYAVNPRTGVARQIQILGSPDVVTGDGLELVGNQLFVVRGTSVNGVTQLALQVRRGQVVAQAIRDVQDPTLDVPATAVFSNGRLWAVNARFGQPNPADLTYSVTGLRVRTGS